MKSEQKHQRGLFLQCATVLFFFCVGMWAAFAGDEQLAVCNVFLLAGYFFYVGMAKDVSDYYDMVLKSIENTAHCLICLDAYSAWIEKNGGNPKEILAAAIGDKAEE